MFAKECRAVLKSIIYAAFLAVIVLFYTTQLGDYAGNDIKQYKTLTEELNEPLSDNPFIRPVPGQDSYGYRSAEIPEQVMPNAAARLISERNSNKFISYKTGFYREIKLSEKQLSEIDKLIEQMTGLSVRDISSTEAISFKVSYEEFKENMRLIDKIIGGGSYYDPEGLRQYGQRALSYEEKLTEYDSFINQDRITGAYARLFCDYMGIVIALFSVFVPVSFLLRDRRAKMTELIYARKKSAAGIVLTRYAALVCMTIMPFLLLSLIPAAQLSLFASQNGMSADYSAFLKYIAGWLLPSVLASSAVAYFFTALTDTPIAILLQFVWSIRGIMTGVHSFEGGRYGTEMAIRHNSLGSLYLVQENIDALITNRLSYAGVSVIFITAAIVVYNQKRRGKLNGFDGFKKTVRNR